MSSHDPVRSTDRLNRIWSRGKDFLGTELPIMCGAMTWISDPELVSRMSNLGAFGVLAAGNMPPELFHEYVNKTRELTDQPFAGNVITIAPNYLEHLDILCQEKVGHIVFAGSLPRGSEVEKAKASGAKVLCFASTSSIAKRMISYGADALILEGSEAGGHIGHVSTMVLLQEILFNFEDTPTFVAGGISSGRMIAHLGLMGAAGAQMGTRFVMAEECNAHDKFKEVFARARAREAISTPQYSLKLPVVSVRALNNHAMTHFGEIQLDLLDRLASGELTRQDAQFKVEEYWVGSLRDAAVDGDVEHGSLMAGQSVGLLRKVQPLREILQDLVDEADDGLARAEKLLG
ncbi:MAG: nitronate monooxygenase family protein [Candidatus Krumholzibacteria bacterium]|nr:nitronate monooxygenase family protein [Candidatus Krumholzibacteria bacterium]